MPRNEQHSTYVANFSRENCHTDRVTLPTTQLQRHVVLAVTGTLKSSTVSKIVKQNKRNNINNVYHRLN